jgi:MFS family permease
MDISTAEAAETRVRPEPIPLKAWIGLSILILVTFLGFLDRQIISLMVGGIKASLNVSDSQIGVLQGAAFGFALLIFAVPFGYFADRYSRRVVLCVGVVIWSLAAAAGGLSNSFSTLMAARIGVAIGEAALVPAANSLIGDMFPKHRLATVFSIFNCGTILGGATALGIGGAVLTWAADGMTFPVLGHLAAWQIALMVTGLPGLVIAVLVLFIPEPKRAQRTKGIAAVPQAPWSEVFRFMLENWRYLSCYIVGFAFLYAATNAQLAWLPTVLHRSYGWTPGQVGAALGIFTAVFGVSGQLTNGMTVDRMLRKGRKDAHLRYYGFATVVVTICGICAQFAPTAVVFLMFYAPIKFFMNYAGVQSAALQLITPSSMRGRVAAVMWVIYGLIGGTAGPSIVAYFTDHVFRDESKVINSLSLTYAILAPSACLLFWLGAKHMREAVVRSEARS